MFDPEFIERVRQAHNIVDIISNVTLLKRAGNQYMGLCPFPNHREKTPSFSVSEDKQIYHCFGCNQGGNLYTFLQEYQGLSFRDAVEYLAQKAGIPIPQQADPAAQKTASLKNEVLKLNEWANKNYIEELKKLGDDSSVKKYLTNRGISKEMIEELGLGWAPDAWHFLSGRLTTKEKRELAQTGGLVRSKATDKETKYFDYFRGRLMFPIYSPADEVLGFGGRTIANDNPKYLNSPDTPVFHKGRVLYGLNWSSRFIRAEDQIILVEGYMDFLALYQAGIKNVAAVLGTALTPDHCKIISRLTRNVVVIFDGDAAGIKAAERSLPVLLAADLLPKCCFLPNKQDPDDFIKANGAELLKEQIKNSEEMFVAMLSLWMKNYSGKSYDKIQLIQKVSPILAHLQNTALRELFLKELEFRLQVDRDWLLGAMGSEKSQSSVNTASQKPTTESKKPSFQEAVSIEKLARAEGDLLGLILKSKDHFEALLAAEEFKMVSLELQKIIALIGQHLAEFPHDFSNLACVLSSHVSKPSIVTKYLNSAISIADAKTEQRLFADCLSWIRRQKYREKSQSLMYKLREKSSPEDLEQFMNINKKRHGILET